MPNTGEFDVTQLILDGINELRKDSKEHTAEIVRVSSQVSSLRGDVSEMKTAVNNQRNATEEARVKLSAIDGRVSTIEKRHTKEDQVKQAVIISLAVKIIPWLLMAAALGWVAVK